MNSRELIKKVVSFDGAPRIGYDFKGEGQYSDFVYVSPQREHKVEYEWHKADYFIHEYPEYKDFEGYLRKDEFGNLWGKAAHDPSPQGQVLKGAISNWGMLDDFKMPTLDDEKRYSHIPSIISTSPDKFRIGTLPGMPFAIMRNLRKMENFLADIILERENVVKLSNMVEQKLCEMVEIYSNFDIDAIFFCEDWGTQDRLLISPQLWRELFKPAFERICKLAHSHGMFVFMHSCGYIYEILEDLIEIGIDVFQLDQPMLMGVDRISEIFRGRVTLFSPVDIQRVLPTGNKELIEKSARELVEKFFVNGGGFIARDYGDYPTIKVKPEWAQWMREEFYKVGGYYNHFK